MLATLWLIVAITLFTFVIGLLFVYKYLHDFSIVRIFKKSSITMKLLTIIIMMFILSLPVQLAMLYKLEPHDLNYGSTGYRNVIDVNDGFVAIGWKSKSGPTITKYDYSGHVLWRKSDKNVEGFDDIKRTASGNIAVTKQNEYLKTSRKLYIYNQEGEQVNYKNISDTRNIYLLNNDQVLGINYDELQDSPSQMTFTSYNLNGEQQNQMKYNYETPESKYNLDYSINLVGETHDQLLVTITAMRYWEHEILEERLLVLNQDLTIAREIKFNSNEQIKKIIQIDDSYYVLWNNLKDRKSDLRKFDSSYHLESEYMLTKDSSYMELNDIVNLNEHLYLIGNQYINKSQVGFTDDYKGVIIDFNLQTNNFKLHELKKGVGLNKMLIKNESVYGIGTLNTHSFFLSNSYMNDNPSMGLVFQINLKDLNKVKLLDVLEDDKYR